MGEFAKFIGYVVLFFFAIGVYQEWKGESGNAATLASKADCRILSTDSVADSYLINDNPDFGYTVRAVIHNVGQEGPIKVQASLSTSEGNFERLQELTFQTNQQLQLSYQFSEPTINATGIQSQIACIPSSQGAK